MKIRNIHFSKKNLIYAALILCNVYMILTIVRVGSYTILNADDFSHGVEIGVYRTDFFSYLNASFKYAYKEYTGWQGTYFSMFFQALLSPVNNYGLTQLKYTMIAVNLLFFVSLIFFMHTALKSLNQQNRLINLAVITSVIFALTNYNPYQEVYYWYSGAVSYSVPLSLLLIGFALILKMNKQFKPGYFIGASVLGFLAMGGSLTVTALGCYGLLLIALYYFIREKKIIKSDFIVFGIWFIGALINALAPGNFVRHGVIDDTGLHLRDSIHDAIYMMDIRLQWFINNTNIAWILLVFIIIGIYVGKKTDFNHKSYYICSILGIAAPILVAFPIGMGYSAQYIPNRCAFLIDFSILLSFLNLFFALGICISGKLEETNRKTVITLLFIMLSVTWMYDNYRLKSMVVLNINKQFEDGIYQNYYDRMIDVYHIFEEGEKGTDLVMKRKDIPEDIEYFNNFTLSDNPDYWVNTYIAKYYGLNSVVLEKE